MFEITRYSRAISQIRKKPQTVKQLKRSLKRIGYKLKTLELIRVVAVILLYSSVISGLASIFPEFRPFIKSILKISGIVGSTICLIIIAITSRYIALYMIDLDLTAAKIIYKNGIHRTIIREKKK